MADNVSPESLAKKWFLLTVVGAAIYFSVVFAFVISGNDKLLEQSEPTKAGQHD